MPLCYPCTSIHLMLLRYPRTPIQCWNQFWRAIKKAPLWGHVGETLGKCAWGNMGKYLCCSLKNFNLHHWLYFPIFPQAHFPMVLCRYSCPVVSTPWAIFTNQVDGQIHEDVCLSALCFVSIQLSPTNEHQVFVSSYSSLVDLHWLGRNVPCCLHMHVQTSTCSLTIWLLYNSAQELACAVELINLW